MTFTTATNWMRNFNGQSDIRRRLRRALCTTLVLCVPFFILYPTFRLFAVRINITSSLARGFYIVSESPAANLVEFCPEGEASRISLERGYRTPGGNCPDGGSPLLKPIAAVPSDRVEVTGDGIKVNGNLIRNSAAHLKDHGGRALKPWPNGQYIVPAGSLWVVSDFNGWSFDSRYFGPIRCSLVRHRLRPLWTFPTKVPQS